MTDFASSWPGEARYGKGLAALKVYSLDEAQDEKTALDEAQDEKHT